MKKIKIRTIMAGPKGVRVPGDIFEVSDAEARRWIKAGYASEVEEEPEPEPKEEPVPESTSVEPPENTSKPAVSKPKARTSRGKSKIKRKV